ncbi:hypothetical protein Acr_07g0012670 [Actinidia rufa]|uniref:Uncharacterized protein n=1 Tax=Actinidia rufa TaxID=165716 RepID=A0A7J0EX64_9ERIC|nr:hypothetical protein Acr_07g0012670 [Actinidia rufa]
MEGSPALDTNPLAAIHPSVEEKANIMTLKELNAFRETYSFPSRMRASYISRRGTRRLCSEDTPAMSRGGRVSSSLFRATNGSFLKDHLGRAPQEFRRHRGFQIDREDRALLSTSAIGIEVIPQLFISPGSMASGTTDEGRPGGEVPSSSGDVELRRILPHIPDQTLLRWSGRKVLDPILNHFMNASSSSSNPTLESYSDLSLPVELKSDEAWKVSECKFGDSYSRQRVVIGEKRSRESLASSPSKKGKVDDGSKGKGVDREPKGKKKATSLSKALTTPATASSHPGKGTSANLSTVLGPTASILGSLSMAEKLLRG